MAGSPEKLQRLYRRYTFGPSLNTRVALPAIAPKQKKAAEAVHQVMGVSIRNLAFMIRPLALGSVQSSATLFDAHRDLVAPVVAEKRCSFIEATLAQADIRPATLVALCPWGCSLYGLITTLSRWCHENQRDPAAEHVWIDLFCSATPSPTAAAGLPLFCGGCGGPHPARLLVSLEPLARPLTVQRPASKRDLGDAGVPRRDRPALYDDTASLRLLADGLMVGFDVEFVQLLPMSLAALEEGGELGGIPGILAETTSGLLGELGATCDARVCGLVERGVDRGAIDAEASVPATLWAHFLRAAYEVVVAHPMYAPLPGKRESMLPGDPIGLGSLGKICNDMSEPLRSLDGFPRADALVFCERAAEINALVCEVDADPLPLSEKAREVDADPLPLSEKTREVDADPLPLSGKTREVHADRLPLSVQTREVFAAFDTDGTGTVSKQLFIRFLGNRGLRECDQRLESMFEYLNSLGTAEVDVKLTLEQFNEATATCRTLVDKCVNGKLRVPDFKHFAEIVSQVYNLVEPNTGGANADYIPQLAQVDPNQFGLSVTTVDGQQFSIGDTDRKFCIQSCSTPLSYLIAQTELGPEYVHNYVGCEPSGRATNEMCLKPSPTADNPNREIPYNPCIDAGAMMTMSMVYPEYNRDTRLEKIMQVWKDLSGGRSDDTDAPIGYDDPTYKSESGSADRKWCLGYMMKGSGALPPCFTTLSDTIELYFQVCSILNTNDGMAIMAATLANGGLNPLTGKRVFSADHVRNTLPIMFSSGMYDNSGQWAYDVGVPAKSGVGGCVFFVVPKVCGISIWSPRLDEVGNSTRGVAAATELVRHFAFHNFEVFSGLSQTKFNPTERKDAVKQAILGELLFAASEGDVNALQAQANAGVDLFQSDYDQRSALHLAASEGHKDAVKFLIDSAPRDRLQAIISAADRWGGTPLSDAIQGQCAACITILQANGACRDRRPSVLHILCRTGDVVSRPSPVAPEILFAAANGDLEELISLKASGRDLTVCDYDRRTALHLAASEGHLDVVRYLCVQAGDNAACLKSSLDRFGGNPRSDAVREGHEEVAAYLTDSSADTHPLKPRRDGFRGARTLASPSDDRSAGKRVTSRQSTQTRRRMYKA